MLTPDWRVVVVVVVAPRSIPSGTNRSSGFRTVLVGDFLFFMFDFCFFCGIVLIPGVAFFFFFF